jgi:hypothetical protein
VRRRLLRLVDCVSLRFVPACKNKNKKPKRGLKKKKNHWMTNQPLSRVCPSSCADRPSPTEWRSIDSNETNKNAIPKREFVFEPRRAQTHECCVATLPFLGPCFDARLLQIDKQRHRMASGGQQIEFRKTVFSFITLLSQQRRTLCPVA